MYLTVLYVLKNKGKAVGVEGIDFLGNQVFLSINQLISNNIILQNAIITKIEY